MLGTLSGLFGTLSLILVSVGVYGVMAFQVARRQKEIGIRMALGARPVQVTGMVLAETAVPVGIGLVMGVIGSFGVTRLAENSSPVSRPPTRSPSRGKSAPDPAGSARGLCAEPPGGAAQPGQYPAL